jgi:DNA modification methylase
MILHGDCIEQMKTLADNSVDCCVTSPPYWGLRDYGVSGQLGLEKTPEEFVAAIVNVFRQVKRVLKKDGTLWLNLGDSYNGTGTGQTTNGLGIKNATWDAHKIGAKGKNIKGLKKKDLVGIPWRVAFALQSDGWYLRQDIIWHKPNPMPESVTDRCTKAHEYIFLLSKSPKYYFDYESIKEPSSEYLKGRARPRTKANGTSIEDTMKFKLKNQCQITEKRNRRSVWTVTTKSFKGAHFATFPPDLIEPCVIAGCPEGGVVLDPFFGAGTTGIVAQKHKRKYIGIELNEEYVQIAEKRISNG